METTVESPDPEPGQLHFGLGLCTGLLCEVSFEKAICAIGILITLLTVRKSWNPSQMPKFYKWGNWSSENKWFAQNNAASKTLAGLMILKN